MALDLKLDDDSMKMLFVTAILEKMGPEKKEELVRQAVASLIEPGVSDYNRRESLMTKALREAASKVATKIVEERLASDETFKAEVDKLVVEASTLMFVTNRTKIIGKLAEGIQMALTGDRY